MCINKLTDMFAHEQTAVMHHTVAVCFPYALQDVESGCFIHCFQLITNQSK